RERMFWAAAAVFVAAPSLRQRDSFMLIRGRFEAAALLAVFGPSVVHHTQGPAQLLIQVRWIPCSWIDSFEELKMLDKTLPGRAQLLHLGLRFVSFALQHDQRARQPVSHFGATAFQFLLPPAQLLQLAFLFFDLLLL